MTELLKGICIIVLIGCVGLIIYSIVNAVKVSKRNKEREEAAQAAFLAKMQKEQNDRNKIKEAVVNDEVDAINNEEVPSQDGSQQGHKELNYDEYENDDIEEVPDGVTLKDFFDDKQ